MARRKEPKPKPSDLKFTDDERNVLRSQGSLPPARVWRESFRCGCGECRFRRPASGHCPAGASPKAITLYTSEERV